MLYRNPDSFHLAALFGRVGALLQRWRTARRRRLTELDLAAMGAHFKRDLGLGDAHHHP